MAENMVRKAEVYGTHRTADSIATHAFLKYTLEDKLKDSEFHLSTRWPYKIERTHVEYLPLLSIPLIEDTLSNYKFSGDSMQICGTRRRIL